MPDVDTIWSELLDILDRLSSIEGESSSMSSDAWTADAGATAGPGVHNKPVIEIVASKLKPFEIMGLSDLSEEANEDKFKIRLGEVRVGPDKYAQTSTTALPGKVSIAGEWTAEADPTGFYTYTNPDDLLRPVDVNEAASLRRHRVQLPSCVCRQSEPRLLVSGPSCLDPVVR
jgi:hypothetical protein